MLEKRERVHRSSDSPARWRWWLVAAAWVALGAALLTRPWWDAPVHGDSGKDTAAAVDETDVGDAAPIFRLGPTDRTGPNDNEPLLRTGPNDNEPLLSIAGEGVLRVAVWTDYSAGAIVRVTSGGIQLTATQLHDATPTTVYDPDVGLYRLVIDLDVARLRTALGLSLSAEGDELTLDATLHATEDGSFLGADRWTATFREFPRLEFHPILPGLGPAAPDHGTGLRVELRPRPDDTFFFLLSSDRSEVLAALPAGDLPIALERAEFLGGGSLDATASGPVITISGPSG